MQHLDWLLLKVDSEGCLPLFLSTEHAEVIAIVEGIRHTTHGLNGNSTCQTSEHLDKPHVGTLIQDHCLVSVGIVERGLDLAAR